jgi:glutaconate CoA-transferase subunit A
MSDARGVGRIFTDPNPDTLRAALGGKPKGLVNKVMSARDAVTRYVTDGCYLASGGFGGVRIPTALLHEVVRQQRKGLGFCGHTTTHDFQILAAGECFDRCDAAYVVGLEMRGLSPNARRVIQEGLVELTEWTNAALLWRLRAAAMGLSFLPTRSMLGTDTFVRSSAAQVRCPFTDQVYAAVPALSPDVALIHVHRADIHGNCQIDGSTVADLDVAAASKRVVVSCERLISTERIRSEPDRTAIPYYMVDAVVEVPYGSFPGNMPGEYYSDEEHIAEWLEVERDASSFSEFLERNIFGVRSFQQYLERNGGIERMRELRCQELLIEAGQQEVGP